MMTGAVRGMRSGARTCGGHYFNTTEEALLRVREVETGNGMEAYRRLHNWYRKQTDMGLAELRQRVIRPVQAKLEENIAK